MSEDIRNIRVTLTLPEDLVATYEAAAKRHNVTLAKHLHQTLAHARGIDFYSRPLILTADDRRDIEALAETTIENGPQLLDLLKNLVRIDMGDVHLYLTEHQMEKFHEYASFYDEPMNEYMETKLGDAVNALLGEW